MNKEVKSEDLSDYVKYRGKCKEMSEALVKENPELRLVRGYYFDALWGKQGHWWCEDKDGNIIDPTKDQFPSKGHGHYQEFDGWFECAQCGAPVHEDKATFEGNYVFCSTRCFGRFVGVPIS